MVWPVLSGKARIACTGADRRSETWRGRRTPHLGQTASFGQGCLLCRGTDAGCAAGWTHPPCRKSVWRVMSFQGRLSTIKEDEHGSQTARTGGCDYRRRLRHWPELRAALLGRRLPGGGVRPEPGQTGGVPAPVPRGRARGAVRRGGRGGHGGAGEVRGHGGVPFRTAGRMVQQRRNGHLQAAHGRQP